MSTTRLKGHVGIVLAGLALVAALAILAGLLPGIAEAQEEEEAQAQQDTGTATSLEAEQNSTTTTTTTDEKGASAAWQPVPEPSTMREPSTTRRNLVVEPGDSLWSISEQQLGPEATPEQIAYEVERIFEFNRDQIGENPNLIFPGQQFFWVSPTPGGGDRAAPVSEEPAVSEGRRSAAGNEESLVAEQQQQAPKPTTSVAESEGVSVSPVAEEAVSEEAGVPESGVSEGAVSEDAVSEDAIPAAPPSRGQTDEQEAQSVPPRERTRNYEGSRC